MAKSSLRQTARLAPPSFVFPLREEHLSVSPRSKKACTPIAGRRCCRARPLCFTQYQSRAVYHDADVIEVLSLKTGRIKALVRGGYFARFLGSGDGRGYLVYVHAGATFGAPFDPERLELLAAARQLGDLKVASDQWLVLSRPRSESVLATGH